MSNYEDFEIIDFKRFDEKKEYKQLYKSDSDNDYIAIDFIKKKKKFRFIFYRR